jgi:hypothetical protein
MLIIECPHCSVTIEIVQINCRIFRCGVLKNTQEPIDPHSSKEKCEYYISKEEIYGCFKPFYLKEDNSTCKCDYI